MPSDQSKNEVILYGICLMLTSAVKTFGFTAYDMLITHMGMKIRVAMCSVVYNKVSFKYYLKIETMNLNTLCVNMELVRKYLLFYAV